MSAQIHSATSWADITPSDTAPISRTPRAVIATGAGNIVMKGSDGTSCTFSVQAGSTLPCQPVYVMATGTTATGIVALY